VPIVSIPPHLRLPPGATARRVHTERGEFAVYDAVSADGPPRSTALLVPGFTGSKEDFIPVLEPLAVAGHRVLAVDQRGQFETPGSDDVAAYDLTELGLDLLAVAAAENAGPVHLVGHSFGGLVVRAAALARPAAVASVTLLCSGPGPIAGHEAERARTLAFALTTFSLDDIWAYASSTARASGEYDDIDPDVVEFMRRRFTQGSHAGMAGMVAQLLDTPDRTDALARAGLPLLVAYGEDDYIWPPAEQEEMARRLGARHEILRGAAHSPAVERPLETARVLWEFWGEIDVDLFGGTPAAGPKGEAL
jgi:pimeloyl-ACP methyl ester carboxylesterase